MPRLIHVLGSGGGFGGAERVVEALCHGGELRGWEQLVIDPIMRSVVQPDSLSLERQFSSSPISRIKRLPSLIMSGRFIRSLLHDFEPSLVHAHLLGGQVALWRSGWAGGFRIATHHHGDVYRERSIEHLDRVSLRSIHRIVAVSHSVKEYLLLRYGLAGRKIQVIPNGWDGSVFPNSANPTNDIVCIGNLRPEKGQIVLLKALQELSPSPEGPINVVFLGEGPQRRTLESFIANTGLTEQAHLQGRQRDVFRYLANAKLLVVPSLVEPFGIAALEGMAAGIPVVASNVGGLPEIVEPGITGELFTPGDHKELAYQLRRLLRDDELRKRMGDAGRKAAQRFKMERTVEQYFELYEDLLTERRAG